jgi:SPOR domain
MPAPGALGEAVRQSFDRMLHTIGGLIGASSPPVPQSDSMSASAGWAVQLAAPRSETEAKSDVRRLSSQYAFKLKGSKIGVHKAVVDGVTVYRLRVVDLSKSEASALCARLKVNGGDCFLAR